MTLASVVDSLNVLLPPIIVCLMILGNYKKSAMVDPVLRRLFFAMTICYILSFFTQFFYNEFYGVAGCQTLIYWLKFLLLTFEHSAFFMTYVFIDYLANRTVRLTMRAVSIVTLLMLAQTVLLIVNFKAGFYYSVTPAGILIREKFYFIRYIYTALPTLMMLNGIIIYKRRALRNMWGLILLFTVPMAFVGFLDAAIGTQLRWNVSVMCLLFAYLFIIRNNMYTDALTGIRNRMGLSAYAVDISRSTHGRPMTIIMMDINDFKRINDKLGHVQGDRALVDVATVLRSSTQYSDYVARIGGDEFAIITRNNQKAPEIIERVQRALGELNAKGLRPYTLSLSIGSYVYDPQKDPSFNYAIDQADKMMYEKKRVAKDRSLRDAAAPL